jgi:NAD(P)H dehydrogenase (quinone)
MNLPEVERAAESNISAHRTPEGASTMASSEPILVTGVPGIVGGVGSFVVEALLARGLPVRALVLKEDESTDALRVGDVEVVVGDLTDLRDVARALAGCRRMYFGMSVSPHYLEATVTTAAVARERPDMEVLVNISQMTVSEMSLTTTTESPQQRLHWLAEQALNWSGLPVVHVRATAFLQHPFFSAFSAESIARESALRLPFGAGRTSPIDTRDVAEVIATVLASPAKHIGKVYELTGPKSQDMHGVAAEYSEALGRPIAYIDVPFEEWRQELVERGLPDHLFQHFLTMARLHAANRYDRLTHDVEAIAGRPPTSIRDYVARNKQLYENEFDHISF